MFEKLFDVFSRREKDLANGGVKPLTPEFRNRVLMLLRDTLRYDFHAFLGQLHNKAAYLYGKFGLSGASAHSSPEDDLLNFFTTCSDENFLDLVELIFRSNLTGVSWPDNPIIRGINGIFPSRCIALPPHRICHRGGGVVVSRSASYVDSNC